MFALATAIVAFLALITDINRNDLMWWWLMFIALHFAIGWGLPIPASPWGRRADGS